MIGILSFVVCCAGVGFFVALAVFIGAILGMNEKKAFAQKVMGLSFVVFWGLGLTIGAIYEPTVSEEPNDPFPSEATSLTTPEMSNASEELPEIPLDEPEVEEVLPVPDVVVEVEPVADEEPVTEEEPSEAVDLPVIEEEPEEEETPEENEMKGSLSFDSAINNLVKVSDEHKATLNEGIDSFSAGEITSYEMYEISKTAYAKQDDVVRSIALAEEDESASAFYDYMLSAMTYVRNNRKMAETLMEFLDKQTPSSQAEFAEACDWVGTLAFNFVEKRMEYLSALGYTDEEILEML